MRINNDFYFQNADKVAPALVGKILCLRRDSGEVLRMRITETECYLGVSDTACHASKGKTPRNSALWQEGGYSYVYLCYGMHWLLNLVTGEEGHPEAVLIRCCETAPGPGRLTKKLGITGELNRQTVLDSDLWVEDDGFTCNVATDKRVGIGYASHEDQGRLWRFVMDTK